MRWILVALALATGAAAAPSDGAVADATIEFGPDGEVRHSNLACVAGECPPAHKLAKEASIWDDLASIVHCPDWAAGLPPDFADSLVIEPPILPDTSEWTHMPAAPRGGFPEHMTVRVQEDLLERLALTTARLFDKNIMAISLPDTVVDNLPLPVLGSSQLAFTAQNVTDIRIGGPQADETQAVSIRIVRGGIEVDVRLSHVSYATQYEVHPHGRMSRMFHDGGEMHFSATNVFFSAFYTWRQNRYGGLSASLGQPPVVEMDSLQLRFVKKPAVIGWFYNRMAMLCGVQVRNLVAAVLSGFLGVVTTQALFLAVPRAQPFSVSAWNKSEPLFLAVARAPEFGNGVAAVTMTLLSEGQLIGQSRRDFLSDW